MSDIDELYIKAKEKLEADCSRQRKRPSELCQAVRRKMFVMFIVYHMQGGFCNEVFAAFPGEFPGDKTNGH